VLGSLEKQFIQSRRHNTQILRSYMLLSYIAEIIPSYRSRKPLRIKYPFYLTRPLPHTGSFTIPMVLTSHCIRTLGRLTTISEFFDDFGATANSCFLISYIVYVVINRLFLRHQQINDYYSFLCFPIAQIIRQIPWYT
jgi:hypothetical protein